jgi:nitroreductase
MDALKTILERRSVREYTDKQVPDEVIKNLLRAGMCAPSARSAQPWEFLVIRDAEKRRAASKLGTYWKMLKDAPLGILVMAGLEGYRGTKKDFFMQDCSAAAENILLAAEAQGLGGVWLGLYPYEDRMKGLREIFGIPEDILPFIMLSIGYPAKKAEPHTGFYADKVHYDKY